MSKRTRLLSKLKYVYSHNAKLVLDVSNDDIGLIIEGVEKQIAKKPVEKYTRYDFNGEYDGDFCKCPNCKNEIIDGFNLDEYYKHCVHCGQKLDWSEADENKEDN